MNLTPEIECEIDDLKRVAFEHEGRKLEVAHNGRTVHEVYEGGEEIEPSVGIVRAAMSAIRGGR